MRFLSCLLAPALSGALLLAAPVVAQEGSSIPSGAQNSLASSSLASNFSDALNAFRRQNGLRGLREDAYLTRAAQAHAEDMARHGYFSHTSRNGSTLFHRVRGANCQGARAFAENIGHGQRSTQEVFAGWAESPGHGVNMLGRQYRSFGLGQSGGYWVLVVADRC